MLKPLVRMCYITVLRNIAFEEFFCFLNLPYTETCCIVNLLLKKNRHKRDFRFNLPDCQ